MAPSGPSRIKDNLRDWSLARVVWVADRGFTSAENRRYLQRGAGGYILGDPGSAVGGQTNRLNWRVD